MMKVLHVISGLTTGGAEMMLYKVASSSAQDVHHSVLCMSEYNDSVVSSCLRKAGITVYYFDFKRIKNYFSFYKILKLVRELSPDIIQGWMYHANLFSSFLAAINKKNNVTVWNVRRSLHALHTEKLSTRMIIRLNSLFSFLPEKIIFNSVVSASQHHAIGFKKNKTVLIPNGFNLSLFSPDANSRQSVRKQLGFSDREIVIGLVGRYHLKKGHALFLDAAKMLIKKYPNARFVLVGTGVDGNNLFLNNKLEELNIAEYVTMLGCRDDVHVIINSFDIATSASLDEAFSNTLGEAMATAIPCVATDVGESKILLDKYGVVVDPNSAHSLYEGWCRVIEMDASERDIMAFSARTHIQKLYSIDVVSSMYENLYKELIS